MPALRPLTTTFTRPRSVLLFLPRLQTLVSLNFAELQRPTKQQALTLCAAVTSRLAIMMKLIS